MSPPILAASPLLLNNLSSQGGIPRPPSHFILFSRNHRARYSSCTLSREPLPPQSESCWIIGAASSHHRTCPADGILSIERSSHLSIVAAARSPCEQTIPHPTQTPPFLPPLRLPSARTSKGGELNHFRICPSLELLREARIHYEGQCFPLLEPRGPPRKACCSQRYPRRPFAGRSRAKRNPKSNTSR